MGTQTVLTLYVAILCSVPLCDGQASISLVSTQYTVYEGGQFDVTLQKTGVAATQVSVVVQIIGDANLDFVGSSRSTIIPAGTDVMTTRVVFTVLEDVIPEPDETFTIQVLVTSGHGVVGFPSSGTVTIVANDDAFGTFSFAVFVPQHVAERPEGGTVDILVVRSRGTSGSAIVSYEVTGTGTDAVPGLDIQPATSTMVFADGEASKEIRLQILPDMIPENNEHFEVELTSVSGGHSIDPNVPGPMLLSGRAQVFITENDAPIRFAEPEYRVDETDSMTQIQIVVYRGFEPDGATVIGPTSGVATVEYTLIPINAEPLEDFVAADRDTLIFSEDSRQAFIHIQILTDLLPEVAESFQLILSKPTGHVVLSDPSVTSVIINANDEPHGVISLQAVDGVAFPKYTINEDTQAVFNDLVVVRSGGSFGVVTLEWQVERNDTLLQVGGSDLIPTQGTVTFLEGETEKVLTMSVTQDLIPEPSELYRFQLLADTVTGGARVEGITAAQLIIEDSDDAHGMLQLAVQTAQALDTMSSPRKLVISLVRTGGQLGDITVLYNVVFLTANGTHMDVLNISMPSSIPVAHGETLLNYEIPIKEEAFLGAASTFEVELLDVTLDDGGDFAVSYNSPSLGTLASMVIPVNTESANGKIGFLSVDTVYADEPVDGVDYTQVPLTITREGTSGSVDIYWSLTSSGPFAASVTDTDVSPQSGVVTMSSGDSMALISLKVLPDILPETAEQVTVELLSVEPAETQRIREGASRVNVVIKENDGPGGVFHLGPDVLPSYVTTEDGDPISLSIVRTGGNLVTRYIEYYIEPEGEVQFYGGTNVIRFDPGMDAQTATVIAKGDGIPELTTTYTLHLTSYEGYEPVTFSGRTFINITVLENDNPYGVFQFDSNTPIHSGVESHPGENKTVNIPVLRTAGRYGSATVLWRLSDWDTNVDLEPTSGEMTFEPGVGRIDLELLLLDDDIPEEDEAFTIILSNATDGATVGSPAITTVKIVKNEDAIRFINPSVMYIPEPDAITEHILTVERQGPTDTIVTVRYRTVPITASPSRDYQPIADGMVLVFHEGVSMKNITVRIFPDAIPEPNEVFHVELYDPSGDAAVYYTPYVAMTIMANDNSNGIFKFGMPSHINVMEGEQASFFVLREQGIFAPVHLQWEILLAGTREPIENGTDFVENNGVLTFKDLDVTLPLTLTPLLDRIPEYQEDFIIRLYNVTGGGPFDEVPLLADDDLEVTLSVLINDDPSGLLRFNAEDMDLSVAEDFYPGNEETTTAHLRIIRDQGDFEEIMVAWEVFSYQIAGASSLPAFKDLMFLGEPTDNVTEALDMRRPHTGTTVMEFNGCPTCYVSVDAVYQPAPSHIMDGFSISAWLRTTAVTVGYIVAKTSADGLRIYYGLKVTTNGQGGAVELSYAIPSDTKHYLAFRHVNIDLNDGGWHLVLVTAAEGKARFYVDGMLQGTRDLAGPSIYDADGELWVGATPGTQPEAFEGYLQDVRVYSSKLEDSEVTSLYEMPSAIDLDLVSGYIAMGIGTTSVTIDIPVTRDNEEESNEVFAVKLISAKGGARINEEGAVAALTVLKSDNANGLFGFQGPCYPVATREESSSFVCQVLRQRGDDMTVFVNWIIKQETPAGIINATADFVNATGQLEFMPGQREATLIVEAFDDGDPELQEVFDIVLDSAISEDGLVGTTDTSGASIDPSTYSSNITLLETDQPYGLIQFGTGNPPGFNDPFVAPAEEEPMVSVQEEVGLVRLLVVRAQGLEGTVSVEWRTIDGTAMSSGKTPPDYQAGVDFLTFGPGERYKFIEVIINDNLIPEGEKTFQVELVNPRNGAEVGMGSTITVTIQHSDQAYGVFQFAQESLHVDVAETMDSDYDEYFLTVVRAGGLLGTVNVSWAVLSDNGDDIVVDSGYIIFEPGRGNHEIPIWVRGDKQAELDEVIMVQLMEVSEGSLGDLAKIIARVTILGNDDPYGLFIISSDDRPARTAEMSKEFPVTIERQAGSGSDGRVRVDYRTLAPYETYAYLPGGTAQATATDFEAISSSVTFEPGEMSREVYITILDDAEPELDEAVYVIIFGVTLLAGAQSDPVVNSPSLGLPSELFAQIIIEQNDYAQGVLEFAIDALSVPEHTPGTFVQVKRTAGTFGQVSVSFEVISVNASALLDYSVSSTNIILYNGQAQKDLPIEIVNDILPELEETFIIRLTEPVTGGATLGSVTTCRVTIQASDDPYGAFGFEEIEKTIDEPEEGQVQVVRVAVVRSGGSTGVIAVQWQATLAGVPPSSDVSPTNNVLYFTSNMARNEIVLNVLPDDDPEGTESILVTLVGASNGGVIGVMSTFTLRILPNDNPHGTVEFALPDYELLELETDENQYITLARLGGTNGALQVFYRTSHLDVLEEMLGENEDENSVFDYYHDPVPGKLALPASGTRIEVRQYDNPLAACARFCLEIEACLSFDFNATILACNWFTVGDTTYVDERENYVYYMKNNALTSVIYARVATANMDYLPKDASIVLGDGESSGQIPVKILPDSIPELNEQFLIKLTSVELINTVALNAQNTPILGGLQTARVTILTNDAANGVFRIFSQYPDAESDGAVVTYSEREQLSVELVVERQGGSIGMVSVTWTVNLQLSTAFRNQDFIADGAILTFDAGETTRTITIGIEDDDLPEDDETIVLQLSNPQGGATLADTGASVTVIIGANDYVAGMLGFSQTAYLVSEGTTLTLSVLRSAPALGDVTADWEIIPVSGILPEIRFSRYNGSLTFRETALSAEIQFEVLISNQPAVNQEYIIRLFDLQTTGISQSGGAAVDPQKAEATVTIEGGNYPHGMFSFGGNSILQRVVEDNVALQVFLDRKFGSIGAVRVYYTIRSGSLGPLSNNLQAAIGLVDFLPIANSSLVVQDGENMAVIMAEIYDDELPEVDEVFLVELNAVELINPTDSTFVPVLATEGLVAQIIINANDGTQGVVSFSMESDRLYVEEEEVNMTLTLLRQRGTFGTVSVFCFAQSPPDGARRGLDFDFEPREIVFAPGESLRTVQVQLYNDIEPEPSESFEVMLASPKGGLTLGERHNAMVTILTNDQAGGVVSFESAEDVTLVEPTDATRVPRSTNDAHSSVELRLTRGPGVYGVVNVPFRVTREDGSDAVDDVTPTSGFITFRDMESIATLTISAVADNEPEEQEVFNVILMPPDNANLGEITTRQVRIERNDAPYGLVQIYPKGFNNMNTSVAVDEAIKTLYFSVVRTQGSTDVISIDVTTRGVTAHAQMGDSLYLATIQEIPAYGVHAWYTYTHNGFEYALMLNSLREGPLTSFFGTDGSAGDYNAESGSQTVLFRWQGSLVPVQTVDTDIATSALHFNIDDVTYLFVCNAGPEGRHEALSRLYSIRDDGSLDVIQDILTKGASGAVKFTHNNLHFLFIGNSINNAGTTTISSDLYQWNYANNRFGNVPVQSLNTQGVTAVEIIEVSNQIFLVVANGFSSSSGQYEINSVIYKLDANSRFTLHQQIPTKGAIALSQFITNEEHYLVLANQRDNIGAYAQKVVVYRWDDQGDQFSPIQELAATDARKINAYVAPGGEVRLVISMNGANSVIYAWDAVQRSFTQMWEGLPSLDLRPMIIRQQDPPITVLLAAEAPAGLETVHNDVYLATMITLGESDYVHSTLTLTFNEGETELETAVVVLEDDTAEDDESLVLELTNPRSGAEIGQHNAVTVNIMSNDNAHGVINFAEDSRERYEQESDNADNAVQLHVMREQGTFGHVVVRWRLTGENNGFYDITPLEGLLEFATGQAVATINLVIKDDGLSELDELSIITLTELVDDGSDRADHGALIGTSNTCRLVVLANDSPHGVVAWERTSYLTTEPQGTDTTTMLHVVREQGTLGLIRVTFLTVPVVGGMLSEQALSGQDYVSTQRTVDIATGVTRVQVEIPILADDIPEVAESFLVNITNVQLIGMRPIEDTGPSVKKPQNIAIVTIAENDNARGVVQFAVERNIENRIDTHEGVGILQLRVTRTDGSFGSLEVAWRAVPHEANVEDYSPPSGTVVFNEGQTESFVEITIVDDNVPEDLQTFEVELFEVTSGGASLGPFSSVLVGILPNDSPTGVFSFVSLQRSVQEATEPNDPLGVVTFDIFREGAEGVVHIDWRLSADASEDFLPPLMGTVTFGPGVTYLPLSLRTRTDSVLEGEERFTLSLVSASNNANIALDSADATVIILAEAGASGMVAVDIASTSLLLGEPYPGYDGTGEVRLTRGPGVFGTVKVTWQIVPRESAAFLQIQGEVTFYNEQEEAVVVVKTKDDNTAELRQVFTLELTSASGGATINPTARSAQIMVTASDYPHGLFQFATPPELVVGEEAGQISVAVSRDFGAAGEVRVFYSTASGSASSVMDIDQDFHAASGWLDFQNNQRRKTISIDIIDDNIAEGTNNYTLVNGLQLDMPPDVGTLVVKTITIDKNDNAEGSLQFVSDTYIAYEHLGVAEVPVERIPGSYGNIEIWCEALNRTAYSGVDFSVSAAPVLLEHGVSLGVIPVQITDDTLEEFAEEFELRITRVQGGAVLGTRTTAIVTIAKSDFPNGEFGFTGQTAMSIPNPETSRTLVFTIARTGGLIGQQTLYWRIMGPNNENQQLQGTSDISYYTLAGTEATAGVLVWRDGEAGQKRFTLVVKPRTGWEIQKVFHVAIYDVLGYPVNNGNGEISSDGGFVAVTVEKYGHPNGIVKFEGEALTSRTFFEPDSGRQVIRFKIYRREGTIGDVEVQWRVVGPTGLGADVEPYNGTSIITGDRRDGEISFDILSDDEPELDESYTVYLTGVIGGGEIDTQDDTSTFTIRYNDYPHGRFSLADEDQTVLVTTDQFLRQVRLNITRHNGVVGQVRITYTIVYNQPKSQFLDKSWKFPKQITRNPVAQSGMSYIPSSGSFTFEDGQRAGFVYINVDNSAFLAYGATFTATLTSVTFLGTQLTMPPELIPGKTSATVSIPETAANSDVGFLQAMFSVDEATQLADVVVYRRGTYGLLQLDWQTGFPALAPPSGFSQGIIVPQSGTVIMPNSVDSTTVRVQLSPSTTRATELFSLYLPRNPVTSISGGASLRDQYTSAQIEPYGVLGFATDSETRKVIEPDERPLEVTLTIERRYGSLGSVQIRYLTWSGTATGGVDFVQIEPGAFGAVNMNEEQTSAYIFIQILADSIPEEDEQFYVNLTSVTRLPTDTTQDLSPRLSELHHTATITIHRNNDPYGVFSIVANTMENDGKAPEPSIVQLLVKRTGGSYGAVSIAVKSIGGGEPWDYDVAITPASNSETIGQALSNRDNNHAASEGEDYARMNEIITFRNGEVEKVVTFIITDDLLPEDDEVAFVYLSPLTDGARVAQPSTDNGRQGYASITIRKNDYWNGYIGFYPVNSSSVMADEDSPEPTRLTIERRNASYGELTVYWRARVSEVDESIKNNDIDLTLELERFSDDIICPANIRFCNFDLPLIDDSVPENASSFVVELFDVSSGAQVDPIRRYAVINVAPNDHPNGLVQIQASSRYTYVGLQASQAILRVERIGFINKLVTVRYSTVQLSQPGAITIAGVRVYKALDGLDYKSSSGILTFMPGEAIHTVAIQLDPRTASSNPYPKMFQVVLSDVTNGAQVGISRANVTISEMSDVGSWEVWSQAQVTQPLDNGTIDSLMSSLMNSVQGSQTEAQMSVTVAVLEEVVQVAAEQPLQQGTRSSIMGVFCSLADPERNDATVADTRLAALMERFAYSRLTEYACDTCCTPSLVYSPSCAHIQFAAAKWYPEDINGYTYQGKNNDFFTLPANLLSAQTTGQASSNPKCYPVVFVEYASSQWFVHHGTTLLNNRVFTVGVESQPSRFLSVPAVYRVHTARQSTPAKRADCVYYDQDLAAWTSGDGVCEVVNNLVLGIDNYVECSCKHMSHYAVVSLVSNPDLIGYPIWFYVACFICMICVAVTIICHHTCILQARFAANLLMHMLFAIFATQLCYVLDAYLSPGHLLNIAADSSNYRCIVMGLFVHYFYLTQFTWIMVQSINFWKVLVLNDEHTERKYVFFFMLGWGLPGLIVAIFYIVTYCIYHYGTSLDSDHIYGDINLNQDICFVTNAYVALAGVIAPALLCLLVAGIVFIQAFQVTPQWQAYDDIYRGRYNLNEVRTLLLFWALIALSYLWGGLHMAFGQLWVLVLFCIFNIASGVFALVVYAVLRNPCAPCFKPQRATYAINYGPGDMGEPGFVPTVAPPSLIGSMKGSKASLINEPWEKESLNHSQPGNNQLRVRRNNGHPAVLSVPHAPYQTKARPNADDQESQDFDELIYALKSRVDMGYSASDSSQPARQSVDTEQSSGHMHGTRRVNIADTHL